MTRSRDIADQQDNLGGAVAPFVGGKNFIFNGAFDIWQRGTSVAQSGSGGVAANYTADRWVFGGSGGSAATISRQVTADTTNLPNIQYCGRYQRNAGNTDLSTLYFAQIFETVNSIPLTGKTVTLSFYARAGANYSAASSSLSVAMTTGTGTDQAFFAFTGTTSILGTSVNLTSSWQRFTVTGTVATNSTQVRLYYSYGPTGTAGANDYYEITGVQVEIGSVATPFARAGGSIGGELALCQRYYEQIDIPTNAQYGAGAFAQNATTVWWSWPVVPKRSTPTIAYSASLQMIAAGGSNVAITSIAGQKYGGGSAVTWYFGCASGYFTAGQSAGLYANAAAASLSFSSEL